ncbi:MAG: RidA family protein [Hyphomicrobiaceae bacterium]
MQDRNVNVRHAAAMTGPMACVVPTGGRRLLISGIVGVNADGDLEKGMRAQLERALHTLVETCEAAGFAKEQIVRIATTVTEPGRFALYKEVRERVLPGHECLSSYVQVSGLSSPNLLCEIEAEAIEE